VQEDSMQFSERLGTLSRAQLQAALDRFALGKLLDARAPAGGLFGQNVFLSSESGEWVFRGAPHWFRGKPHATWQFAKERWFAERIHAQTSAPAPWPYLVETSGDLFGWAYALMPRLPGERAEDVAKSLPLDDRRAIARALGAALAELHRLRGPASGDYDPELDAIRPDTSLRSSALRALEDVLGKSRAEPPILDREDVALIDASVRDADAALDVPAEPCCVHLDYHHGNVNVERAAGAWRVSGIFDLMTCELGDGERDLARPISVLALTDPPLVAAFLDAYRALRPLRAGARERFRLYMLIDRLLIWQYGRRNRVWFSETSRFRDFVGFYLGFDSQLEVDPPPRPG
jgi:hygromycin-B 7''-O-kinase